MLGSIKRHRNGCNISESRITSIVRIYHNDLIDKPEHGDDPYTVLTDEPTSRDGTTQGWVFAFGTMDRSNNDNILEEHAHLMHIHVYDLEKPSGLLKLKKRTPRTSDNELSTDLWFRVSTAKILKIWENNGLLARDSKGKKSAK
ncbi:hypothetical protein GGR53DRAFT_485509 [Hypoxylon sp. FL1150]|nr:hypothetical protein GGR53DRAFT_485509 [Hypoxylon sp. FL1150]